MKGEWEYLGGRGGKMQGASIWRAPLSSVEEIDDTLVDRAITPNPQIIYPEYVPIPKQVFEGGKGRGSSRQEGQSEAGKTSL